MVEEIAEQLREVRRAAGLSQRDVAQLMHCKQSQISEWESGVVPPKVGTLRAWASALGLDLEIRLIKRRSDAAAS